MDVSARDHAREAELADLEADRFRLVELQRSLDGCTQKVVELVAKRQAREAEIRALIATWRKYAKVASASGMPSVVSAVVMCAADLEALLTPPQEREPRCPICGENEKCRCPETGGYRR
jgi:hypothetical protein